MSMFINQIIIFALLDTCTLRFTIQWDKRVYLRADICLEYKYTDTQSAKIYRVQKYTDTQSTLPWDKKEEDLNLQYARHRGRGRGWEISCGATVKTWRRQWTSPGWRGSELDSMTSEIWMWKKEGEEPTSFQRREAHRLSIKNPSSQTLNNTNLMMMIMTADFLSTQ